MALPPQTISPNYSFRFDGTDLEIYQLKNEDSPEVVSLETGNSFTWNDGDDYELSLRKVIVDQDLKERYAENAGMAGPSSSGGLFELKTTNNQGELVTEIELNA